MSTTCVLSFSEASWKGVEGGPIAAAACLSTAQYPKNWDIIVVIRFVIPLLPKEDKMIVWVPLREQADTPPQSIVLETTGLNIS